MNLVVREVNVKWLRALLWATGAGLVLSIAFYSAPAGANEPFLDPFDRWAVRDWVWFGEAPTTAEWVGVLNTMAGVAYVVAGGSLYGRVKLRSLGLLLALMGGMGMAGVAGLLYLAAAEPSVFPLSSPGARPIELFHALGLGGLALAWWRLRKAASANPSA